MMMRKNCGKRIGKQIVRLSKQLVVRVLFYIPLPLPPASEWTAKRTRRRRKRIGAAGIGAPHLKEKLI